VCGDVVWKAVGMVSKTVVRASVPWVRIPPSPPPMPIIWLITLAYSFVARFHTTF
jgi:hypothetical protein